jgi:hypothetical protein
MEPCVEGSTTESWDKPEKLLCDCGRILDHETMTKEGQVLGEEWHCAECGWTCFAPPGEVPGYAKWGMPKKP